MRKGKQTVLFDHGVYILSGAGVVGKKEGQGPLGKCFDVTLEDDLWGEDSFEKAERKMLQQALETAKLKAGMTNDDIDMIIGGDLLNQIISASFAAKDLKVPFLGVYGACSTMCESMLLAGCLIDGGFSNHILCAASSHFSSAERQYRYPLEYGSQRTPTAQWTVTGSGCSLLSNQKSNLSVVGGCFGKILDWGISDVNNMGSAMAPAAADTINTFLDDTATKPEDYDLILTGDLGKIGKQIFCELMKQKGKDVTKVANDCGCLIFSQHQDVHAGGSGCGCAASVFNCYIRPKMEQGELKNVLLAATGALMSTTSSFQGENIPGISYAVHIRSN